MPLLCRSSSLQETTGMDSFWEGEESGDAQVRIQALSVSDLLRATVQ